MQRRGRHGGGGPTGGGGARGATGGVGWEEATEGPLRSMRPLRCVCRSSASGTFRFDGLSVDVPPLCLTGFAVRRPGRFPCVLSEPFRCMPVSWSGFVPYCPSERQCSACRAVLCGSPDAACFAGAENCGHREETPPFYSLRAFSLQGCCSVCFGAGGYCRERAAA